MGFLSKLKHHAKRLVGNHKEIIEETKSGPETKESIFHLFSLLGVRCGGFYGAMAGLVKNKQLALLSTNMAQVTAISEQLGAKTEVEKALTEAMDQVLKTKDIYRAIMIENNTRNLFGFR